ncbi:MAG: protein kinase [Clostridia bacterium]|nr:protein kinase [Clostridia bacterium]
MSVEKLAQIWPEWEIEKQLGRGSYGVVYKAVRRDNNVESHAAIKVISIPSDESEVDSLRSEGLDMDGTRTYFKGIVDDFVSEIQLMESLKGIQNIVSVEDYKVIEKTDSIGWDIYIRMELLTPFNTFVCDKKLSEKDVIKLGIDICTALEICGQRNIIHRDIKPENIFVNGFGYFKLGDFGIARKLENMTGGLSQKGTFNYMAPEVANSNTYDARVDTYSLGIVLYRLLNGNRLPFLDTEKQLLNPNERKNAVERRIRGEELHAPCEASPEMANLILRACAYNPDMRFASATAMKEALISVGNGTYVPVAADLDKTTAVRHAQADYDATTAVRKAPQTAEVPMQNNANSKNEAVPTFGRKKTKAPKIIAIVLVIALLVGGAVVAYPYIRDFIEENSSESSETNDSGSNVENPDNSGDYSSNAAEQIQSIISDAEKFAKNNNYEKAIDKIEAGLVSYPYSVELQNKLDEYTTKLAQQNKQKVLDDAAALANKEDYLGALKKIEAAQKDLPDDVDYEIAYDNYCSAYEDSVIAQADSLAANKDYEGAIALVEMAQTNVKSSAKLEAAKQKYVSNLPAEFLYNLQYTEFNNQGQTSNDFYLIHGSVTSHLGEIYEQGIVFKHYYTTVLTGDWYKEFFLKYNLNQSYARLCGSISMIKTVDVIGANTTDASTANRVCIEFIGDGATLYKSPMINPTAKIDFDIDISGINELKIVVIPSSGADSGFHEGYFALTGLELYGG